MAHVAYATRSGAAEDAAAAIADVMREAGHTVDLADLKTKPSPLADLVVVGSGVNAASWYSESIGWLAVNSAALKETRVNGSYDDDTRAVVRTIQQRLGISTPLGEREGWVAFLDGATRG